jgi:hypothetical protein
MPDGQQRIRNRRRVSHPAISTCSRPPRTCLSGSGLPTAVPAPRDARLAAIAGPGRPDRNAAQAAEFTDRRVVLMAFWTQHARPQKLRPTPIGAWIHAESGQGSDVAEIICLVTVTCDGNGAAAAARPATIPTGACGGSSGRGRPRAQAGTRHRRASSHRVNFHAWIAQPARFPARVGLRPGEAAASSEYAARRPGGSASRSEGKSR